MEKASSHAYVSKKWLDKYAKKKQALKEQKEEKKNEENLQNVESEEEYSEEELNDEDLGSTIDAKKQVSNQPQQQQQIFQNQPQQLGFQIPQYQPNIFSNIQQQPQLQQLNFQPQQQFQFDLSNQIPQQQFLQNLSSNQIPQYQQQIPLQQPQNLSYINQPNIMPPQQLNNQQQPQQFFYQYQQIPQQYIQQQPQQTIQIPQPQQQVPQAQPQKYKKEVDTNVCNIRFSVLEDEGEIATGDPILCKKCSSVFNKFSQITYKEGEEQEQTWNCEFCLHPNQIRIEEQEIPKSNAVNYIIEAAPQKTKEEKKDQETTKTTSQDDITIIFCIDISGSMGGSRITCVKEVLKKRLQELKENYPNRRVGLLAFESTVHFFGDGSCQKFIFLNQDVNNYDYLVKNGTLISKDMIKNNISQSEPQLQFCLQNLQPMGSTALGPGLLAAAAIAGEGSPGSMVILCTDGAGDSEHLYATVGKYAKSKGVIVNMMFIEGSECNIQALSAIAEDTNGDIARVNTSNMDQNFGNSLQKVVIATQVQLKVKLHKGLEFRNEEESSLSADKTVLTKDVGNVTRETEITFEYKMKRVKELVLMDDIDLETLKNLPFQAQIEYRSKDGAKCIRVISDQFELSNDKQKLKENANYDILGLNAIKQTSKLAKKGDYQQAQVYAKAWDNQIKNNHTAEQKQSFDVYRQNMEGMYKVIAQQQPQNVSAPQQQYWGQQQQLSAQPRQNDFASYNFYQNSQMSKNSMQKQQQWNQF